MRTVGSVQYPSPPVPFVHAAHVIQFGRGARAPYASASRVVPSDYPWPTTFDGRSGIAAYRVPSVRYRTSGMACAASFVQYWSGTAHPALCVGAARPALSPVRYRSLGAAERSVRYTRRYSVTIGQSNGSRAARPTRLRYSITIAYERSSDVSVYGTRCVSQNSRTMSRVWAR